MTSPSLLGTRQVMLIPEPEELVVGQVVQFNASAGCANHRKLLSYLKPPGQIRYGFIKPSADSVFQQDVYFNIKELHPDHTASLHR